MTPDLFPPLNEEKFSDPLDVATDQELRHTQHAIDAARSAVRQRQSPGPDGTYAVTDCEECGNEIGEGRLKHSINNLWCIFCATAHEKRTKR